MGKNVDIGRKNLASLAYSIFSLETLYNICRYDIDIWYNPEFTFGVIYSIYETFQSGVIAL